MKNATWVNYWKLRASSGYNGNVAKSTIPEVQARYSVSPWLVGVTALNITSYANPGLKWEQTYNFNVGTDFRLFSKLNGSIDYYIKNSRNLLGTMYIDPTLGTNAAEFNRASINNRGLEITLNTDWITRRTFNWNQGIVFSYNVNKVIEVLNQKNMLSYNYITTANANYLKGYSVGTLFAYPYAGLDSLGYPLIWKDGEKYNLKLGDPGDLGTSYLVYKGNSIPAYNISMSNRFDIGNFYLYFFLTYYGGFNTRIPVKDPGSIWAVQGSGDYFSQKYDDTDIKGFVFSRRSDNSAVSYDYTQTAIYNYQDKNIVKGDYVVLRDVTLSYTIRPNVIKKIGLQSLDIKLQGSNLWTKGFNDYNYSAATGSFFKRFLTPTYTIGLITRF